MANEDFVFLLIFTTLSLIVVSLYAYILYFQNKMMSLFLKLQRIKEEELSYNLSEMVFMYKSLEKKFKESIPDKHKAEDDKS